MNSELKWSVLEEQKTNRIYVCITHLYIEPNLRGKGLARQTMKKALEKLREDYPGKQIVLAAQKLEPTTDTYRLVKFYESLGFEQTGTSDWSIFMKYNPFKFSVPINGQLLLRGNYQIKP